MSGRIEKTVFISYRRTNLPWALFVYQYLTTHGYDVFFDYQSIDSGDFEKLILDNIKARAHFIVILTPLALENCKNPGDWLRREIETAIDESRNIIPIMVENFDFGSTYAKEALTGKLANLSKCNGLPVPNAYAFEATERLRGRYLNKALREIPKPALQTKSQKITEDQKLAANKAAPVQNEQLTAQSWFESGYVFAENKNFDEAIRCYTNAIELQPDFAVAYVNRGAAFGEKGDLAKAISDLRKGIRLEPNNARAYNNIGVALHAKGDLKNSIKNYAKALSLNPNSAFILSNRASVFADLKKYEDAINDCSKAIQINPNLSEAFNNRGVAFEHIGDMNQAIKDFTKAIRLKPDYAAAYRNRGNARDELGDSKNAIRDYTKAILFKPGYSEAYYDRGVTYINMVNLDAALKDFSQAIFLNPRDVNAYFNRGLIFEITREKTSALADFQKYLDLGGGKQNGNQKEVEKKIKKLRINSTKNKSAKKKTK